MEICTQFRNDINIMGAGELAGDFPDSSVLKNLPANARDVSLIPGLGRSLGEGNGNPFQ